MLHVTRLSQSILFDIPEYIPVIASEAAASLAAVVVEEVAYLSSPLLLQHSVPASAGSQKL